MTMFNQAGDLIRQHGRVDSKKLNEVEEYYCEMIHNADEGLSWEYC
jgi:hypothetical protein